MNVMQEILYQRPSGFDNPPYGKSYFTHCLQSVVLADGNSIKKETILE